MADLWLPSRSNASLSLREPALLHSGSQPRSDVVLKRNNLTRNANFCLICDGRGPYQCTGKYRTIPGRRGLAANCTAEGIIDIPSNVCWLESTNQPNTIIWGEYAIYGVLNQGAWKIYLKTGTSCFHIYGGSNASYRDWSIRQYAGTETGIQFNSGNTTPNNVYRVCGITYDGSVPLASINGLTVSAGPGTFLGSTSNTTSIGKGYDFMYGFVSLFYVFHSSRSQAELNQLTKNPYQIWEPVHQSPYLFSDTLSALPFSIGSTQITSASLGSTPITEIWKGNTKLWP